MLRSSIVAVFAVVVAAVAAAADKKGDKPLGAWTRKLPDDAVVTFTFDADKMKCEVVTANGETVTVHGAYGVTEDGLLFGVMTRVEKKGTDSGPEKGELFSFKFKPGKDVLTLSDYKSSVDRPQDKVIVEGEYKKK
jgi:hypothetical protein